MLDLSKRYRVVGLGTDGVPCEECGKPSSIFVTEYDMDEIAICKDCAEKFVDKGGPKIALGNLGR